MNENNTDEFAIQFAFSLRTKQSETQRRHILLAKRLFGFILHI